MGIILSFIRKSSKNHSESPSASPIISHPYPLGTHPQPLYADGYSRIISPAPAPASASASEMQDECSHEDQAQDEDEYPNIDEGQIQDNEHQDKDEDQNQALKPQAIQHCTNSCSSPINSNASNATFKARLRKIHRVEGDWDLVRQSDWEENS
ncbi:uncharacterized protein IL334_007232 [Kwoniella shivajii]|uniref:Uncharacterized protein n=1 Tax=Kwoniella shivajii TaxID=564305 RepID=A0ABZ1D843_9TREE|nr:hypothetical protein IL334_007232 [Kwoniella shivajii]